MIAAGQEGKTAVRNLPHKSLRILFAGELWFGSDSYAYCQALRRSGHSVTAIETANFMPTGWRTKWLRGLRRGLFPWLLRDYEAALVEAAEQTQPHLFVGFKAPYVTPAVMDRLRSRGCIAINVYPDVSVMAHGPLLPKTLPLYDWVFTTKSFGLADMERELGITKSSFFVPAFDPEVHQPVMLDEDDQHRYGADVSFIGTFQSKNENYIAAIASAIPEAKIKVWGMQWEKSSHPALRAAIQYAPVFGLEYSKCVIASRINLALLREQQPGSSSADLITQRTFGMPACGGFMLHERTDEVMQYFEEGTECAIFSDTSDLIGKVRYYLEHDGERRQIAQAGRARSLASGYSVDARVDDVIAKYYELRATKP